MKEECMDGGYAYLLHRRLSQKCGIIGAGSKRLFMRDFHAGAKAYLVGLGNFFPQVAKDFYAAMRGGQIDRAHAIVRAYEDPFFDVAVSLGWHLALKETMYLLNLMPPHERDPLPRLNDAQQAKMRDCVDKLGWRSRAPNHGAIV
jgi:dihydrodipicolinate synthase/N-acetylneuraminate lyase